MNIGQDDTGTLKFTAISGGAIYDINGTTATQMATGLKESGFIDVIPQQNQTSTQARQLAFLQYLMEF